MLGLGATISGLLCTKLSSISGGDVVNSSYGDKLLGSCTFCNVSTANGFNIIWENDDFIAFRDRKPACMHHIQLIPKRHIRSVRELQKSDVELVKSMSIIGHQILDELAISSESNMRKMGFHIPPFNSINHLHLHVQGLPYRSFAFKAKYPVAQGHGVYQKGFSWFVEVEQAVSILERGGRIGVLSC